MRRGLSEEDGTRFRLGSDEQLAALIDRYTPRLRHYAARFARDADDLDDLLQDTWCHALERRQALRSPSAFDAWLRAVCRTVCVGRYRRQRREARQLASYAHLMAQDVAQVAEVTSDAVWRQRVCEAATDALMALAPRQRIAVIARVMLNQSTTETARLMGCAEGTVKATLHQAIGALRRTAPAPTDTSMCASRSTTPGYRCCAGRLASVNRVKPLPLRAVIEIP